jgi:hypothetical protein
MAERQRVKVVFQFRRATTEEWNKNASQVPYAGEPCFDLSNGTLRIGDGNTPYKDLKVIGSTSTSDDDISLIIDDMQLDIDELQELVGDASVENQIADAIANINYEINEVELQDMINSVLDN